MHIPDGYLSPIMSLGAGIVTVPAWALAVRRVQAVLNNRTVPLLAIFSAFTLHDHDVQHPRAGRHDRPRRGRHADRHRARPVGGGASASAWR